MHRSAQLATALAAALVLVGSTAWGQQVYQVQTGVDSQYFEPGSGANDILGVRSSAVVPHLGGHAGLFVNLSQGSLRLRDVGTGARYRLVDLKTGVDVVGSIGLLDWVEVGLSIPATLWQDGETSAVYVLDTGSGVEGAGMGDLCVTPKVRLLGGDFPFRISFALPLGFPSGDHERYMGHDGFSIAPTLLLGGTLPFGLEIEGNVGVRWRPSRSVMNVVVGPDVTWGLGARVPFEVAQDQRLAVLGSFVGAASLDSPIDMGLGAEGLLALQYSPLRGLAITAGAGAGLGVGLGPPEWRVLVGVDYRWPGDGEGAPECLHGPEDLDGFRDDDGCGDPDNDEDGVDDVDDVCPFEPETLNDYRDEDGCPDQKPTTDPFAVDPTAPTPAPVDPHADSDGDGVPDVDDVCPERQEDLDSFEDGDGCPDVDNDRDGVPDRDDRCPLEAEVVNGVDDDDGCPDAGESKVAVTREAIVILEKVYFDTAEAKIKRVSHPLLDQVVAALRAHTEITLVVIEGHTDSISEPAYNLDLSRRRAEAVREYLIGRGVDASRLEARGLGEDRPIADNETAEGREENRRVEFHVVEIDGRPAPTSTPTEQERP